MNCYYSNLIEGHDTHPVAIERALRRDFDHDPVQRDLQIEARAHISVQQWIDGGGLEGRSWTLEGLLELHRRFCHELPESLLLCRNVETGEASRIHPGEFRTRPVIVGRHVPVSPGALPRFMMWFEDVYSRLGRAESILASAAAHHRLLWIHPFLDGNGRVARLMSHAALLERAETGGLWSLSRGLARSVTEYKGHLADCDQPRRNDLDGRGRLSEEALSRFTSFFLETCIDQVEFMRSLVQPDELRSRILGWVLRQIRKKTLPPRSDSILEIILYRGSLDRGEVSDLLGVSSRHARRLVHALADAGVLTSAGSRDPLELRFPARLAGAWMPGLFPDST